MVPTAPVNDTFQVSSLIISSVKPSEPPSNANFSASYNFVVLKKTDQTSENMNTGEPWIFSWLIAILTCLYDKSVSRSDE